MRIRSDGKQRREQILEVACFVFGEKGYHKATFSEMAKQGKFNGALISFHFRSKDDLYHAVWLKLSREVQDKWPIDGGLAEDAPGEERLRAHVRASIARHKDNQLRAFVQIHNQERVNPTGLVNDELQALEKIYRTHMLAVITDLLGVGASDRDVRFCEMSVINQLSIVRPHVPDNSYENKERCRDTECSMTDIDQLTEHITQFSLGGIEAIRKKLTKRKILS